MAKKQCLPSLFLDDRKTRWWNAAVEGVEEERKISLFRIAILLFRISSGVKLTKKCSPVSTASAMSKSSKESEDNVPKYRKLRGDGRVDDGCFDDSQFERPKGRVPWKAITFAVFLFVNGSLVIMYSLFKLFDYEDTEAKSRSIALLVLGLLMFIPGSYHVALAYLSYHEYPGYSFDDILDFD